MMIFIIVTLTGDSSQNFSEYKNMTATVSTYIMLICSCKDNNVLWLTVYLHSMFDVRGMECNTIMKNISFLSVI